MECLGVISGCKRVVPLVETVFTHRPPLATPKGTNHKAHLGQPSGVKAPAAHHTAQRVFFSQMSWRDPAQLA